MSIQFDVITKRYPIKIFYMIFIPAKLSEGGKMTKLKGKSDFFFFFKKNDCFYTYRRSMLSLSVVVHCSICIFKKSNI